MWNVLPSTPASPEALRSNLSLSPDPERSVDPSPSNRFGSPERSPSEYLIAAGGNVSEAAAAAGLSKAEFLQDLGLDASLPQVSNAAHFLVLMGALSLTQLAQDHLQHLLFEAATAEDASSPSSPFPQVSDPTSISAGLEALAQAQPSKVSFKEATLLWKHAADFVSAAMAQANPSARPSRFTPPSDRSRIIQASRGLPTATADHPDPDQQPHNPPGEADAELDVLRQKLRESPPHIRDMLARALGADQIPADPYEAEAEAEAE